MMAKRRRRRRNNFAGIFIKTLIVVLIIAGLLYYGKGFVKQKVENKVAETIVTQMAGSDASLPNGKSAKEVYGSMSAQDQKKIQTIVDDHLDSKTASKVQEYITKGDTQGLKEYAQNSLTEEERAQLRELYEKYAQ